MSHSRTFSLSCYEAIIPANFRLTGLPKLAAAASKIRNKANWDSFYYLFTFPLLISVPIFFAWQWKLFKLAFTKIKKNPVFPPFFNHFERRHWSWQSLSGFEAAMLFSHFNMAHTNATPLLKARSFFCPHQYEAEACDYLGFWTKKVSFEGQTSKKRRRRRWKMLSRAFLLWIWIAFNFLQLLKMMFCFER